MKTITSEVKIKANIVDVWNVVNNFPEYPKWNPFILYLKGNVAVGNRIEVKVKPVGGSNMIFKPIVLTYVEYKEISWIGRLFVRGIFDGEHILKLIENKDGSTTFIQAEKFTGILVPFFSNMIGDKTLKGFKLMNMKLKELVER